MADVTFDYAFVTATCTTGDYTVWVEGLTSGMIQPAGYQIQGATVGVYQKHKATFQLTTTDTQYRVAIHQTGSPTAAIKFDNVRIGPPERAIGAVVTDWVSFTPTGSWTTNTTYTGYWKRNGDSINVQVKIALAGAPDTATLTVNLPSGYSFDTSKLVTSGSTNKTLGTGNALDAGNTEYGPFSVAYASTTSVGVWTSKITSHSGTVYTIADQIVTNAIPITWGASDTIHLSFSGPISGWSSNVQMSNDTDTRVVAAFYTGQPTGTLSAADNLVTYPTKVIDTHGSYSSGSYTVSVPGVYRVNATLRLETASVTANQYFITRIKQSGVTKGTALLRAEAGSITDRIVAVSAMLNCVAGDTIQIYSNTDFTGVTYNSVSTASNLHIERLSGPSQIAATETVAALYSTPATTTINTATQYFLDFGTKITDTHGSVLGSGSGHNSTYTSTWRFVTPISGLYQIQSAVGSASVTGFDGTGERIAHTIYIDGAYTTILQRLVPASSDGVAVTNGMTIIRLLAGQVISIGYTQNSGNNWALNNSSEYRVSIVRVGNY
jgi:hypothetical protein